MATTDHTSFRDDLASYNQTLDDALEARAGMSLKTFKTIKALTQLLGAAAGVYAMSLGAPPLASFALIAVIISGPEALEYLIKQGDAGQGGDNS